MKISDLLSADDVAKMLSIVDRAYADRAHAQIAREIRSVEMLAKRGDGDEDERDLHALVVGDPLFTLEAEQEYERRMRAAELGTGPEEP
jgi:hypothetical protein